MLDMCDTREMCEARKSRSSRGRRASARDLCMRDVLGAPRPEALRAWKRVTLQVITGESSYLKPWNEGYVAEPAADSCGANGETSATTTSD